MTDDDVIQMMRQAGLTRTKYAPSFRRLIEIAVAAEREACAKVCEHFLSRKENDDAWIITMDLALQAAADVIRRREIRHIEAKLKEKNAPDL